MSRSASCDTDASITLAQNPFNIRGNYGNADYDVRHYFSANFVLTDMFRHAGFHYGPNRIFGGWTLSSNWFFRTGLPFTVDRQRGSGRAAGLELQRSDFRLAGDEHFRQTAPTR